jgi:hypothetical protein
MSKQHKGGEQAHQKNHGGQQSWHKQHETKVHETEKQAHGKKAEQTGDRSWKRSSEESETEEDD